MSKAIIIASFGTTDLEALKNLDKIEDEVRVRINKKYPVIRVFTSKTIINSLKVKHNISVLKLDEALFKLSSEGFEEVIIQPLHIMECLEYEEIKKVIYSYDYTFKSIKIGKTLLGYYGSELENACDRLICAMDEELPKDKNIVLVGHGSKTITTEAYYILESKFRDKGYSNLLIGTLEGDRTRDFIVDKLKNENIDEVLILPLLVIAGNHAKLDIAGDEKSWKSKFLEEGIKVDINLKALLEYKKVRNLYINQIERVL
ncbi:sirohydrochlorin cobaltochelatase [Clostridium septicum]|uniref:Cobalt chelatase n=1 Tax=Clostridium septicum TaxID=1504 RepID=A0A9N7JJ41_CLOSE|nr:sirohydrochlorin cobaltochelatase [Clostridium septicum]AYE33539.1 cobalt chelatase [Clostridium septicum]MDU1313813.1 sirohydrochlorin cobaltochelatase [Clostridium septicum]QAS61702.1 cobalt chelatase [Clostridium septicum]UEC21851.1 sirohydrochlorin cobaltochelatase [Clostridium septicum]USS00096.1 sirohydrochlorin cobaltochelatase [Clostridium septicum]